MTLTRIAEIIHERLGWCPHVSYRKTRVAPALSSEGMATAPVPGEAPVPVPAAMAAPAGQKSACPENILLILLLVAGLFSLVDLKLFALFGLVCVIAVYYDAVALHAGEKFAEDSFFGDVVTWRPLSWAVWVLIFSVFFLAVYVVSRDEIWKANN